MVLRFDTSFLNYKPEFLETPVGTQNFVNTRASDGVSKFEMPLSKLTDDKEIVSMTISNIKFG